MSPSTDMVGQLLDGKLRIERTLASGAAGDVYEAHHLGLGTQVAVKLLRPGGGETADIRRRRFLREARVAARLRSPHVVRVFDVVAPEEGPTYIVMELLQGETLAERVRREGALPIPQAVELVRQAAHALAEMHEAGIVHRDVKPSNLFLAREADGKQTLKLLDFGVAALRQPLVTGESSITFSEAFVGTPRYMAPEQVRSSKSVDARADVWALGVTLYELLTGSPPFDGQTVIAVLNQIERGTPALLEQLRPDVPAGLAALLRRCMTRDPAGRPSDARSLGEELGASGEGGARDESRRGGPWTRRAALVVASAVAVTLVVLVSLRRSGDARPTVALDVPPSVPAPSAAALPASAAVASEPAASATPEQPASPTSPARMVGPARPRPRPAIARPPAAPLPPRQDDDRIE